MVCPTMKAIVVGGAQCVWDDIDALREIAGDLDEWLIVAVNDVGLHLERIDHWCSLHPDRLVRWIRQRTRAGKPDASMTWYGERVDVTDTLDRKLVVRKGGASGLLGIDVAEEVAAIRIVLCGIPMDDQPHFEESTMHRPEMPWYGANRYRPEWEKYAEGLRRTTRSMSGWTRGLLGYPTTQWLELEPTEAER